MDDTTAHFMLLELSAIRIARLSVTSNEFSTIIIIVPNYHEAVFGG